METLHLSSAGCLEELVVGGDKTEETILQKFQRLQCEVSELLQEMDSLPESSRETELVGVALQVDGLNKQLSSCQLTDQGTPVTAPVDSLSEKISSLTAAAAGPGTAGDPGPGLYQLFLTPGQELDTARLAALDKRLAALESLVGPEAAGTRSVLSGEAQRASLSGACRLLAMRRQLLDSSQLDHVEGRLAALTNKMNNISEQKKAVKTAVESGKVNRT